MGDLDQPSVVESNEKLTLGLGPNLFSYMVGPPKFIFQNVVLCLMDGCSIMMG